MIEPVFTRISSFSLIREKLFECEFIAVIEKVKPYYCEDNGRPSLDPLILFKMIFFGIIWHSFGTPT